MTEDRKHSERPLVISAPTGCPPWEHDVSICGKYIQTGVARRAPQSSRAATEAQSDDERVRKYGKAIWNTSRRDEGTISVTGANIVARAVMAVADEELAMFKRGGRTLGQTIEWQCRAALDATGLHHLIDEDGDGDWALVWEHLAELGSKVARVEALLEESAVGTQPAAIPAETIRAALADPEPEATETCGHPNHGGNDHDCAPFEPEATEGGA